MSGLAAFNEAQPIDDVAFFVAADGNNSKPVTAVRTSNSRIDNVICSNTDGIAHVVNVFLHVGGVDYPLGSVNVPAGQGLLGTPGIDVLAGALPAGVLGVALIAGAQLSLGMAVAITGGSHVWCSILGGTLP